MVFLLAALMTPSMNVGVASEVLRYTLRSSHKRVRDHVGHAEALGCVDVVGKANSEAGDWDTMVEEPKRYLEDSDTGQNFGKSHWGPKQGFPGDYL